jgi:hypothetical protein
VTPLASGVPVERVRCALITQYRGEPTLNPTDRGRDFVPFCENPSDAQSPSLELKSRELVISEAFQLSEDVIRSIHLSPARLMWRTIVARMVLDVTMGLLVIHSLQPAVVTRVVRMIVVDQTDLPPHVEQAIRSHARGALL